MDKLIPPTLPLPKRRRRAQDKRRNTSLVLENKNPQNESGDRIQNRKRLLRENPKSDDQIRLQTKFVHSLFQCQRREEKSEIESTCSEQRRHKQRDGVGYVRMVVGWWMDSGEATIVQDGASALPWILEKKISPYGIGLLSNPEKKIFVLLFEV